MLLCGQCPYKTDFPYRLRKHVSAAHRGAVFRCDQCDYTAPRNDYITKHKKVSHGEKHLCQHCGFSTGRWYLLKKSKISETRTVKDLSRGI